MKSPFTRKLPEAVFAELSSAIDGCAGYCREKDIPFDSIAGVTLECEVTGKTLHAHPYPMEKTAANALCFSRDADGDLCILMGQVPETDQWITPAGEVFPIEPGRPIDEQPERDTTLEDAALRNLKTKAGVDARELGVQPIMVGYYPRIQQQRTLSDGRRYERLDYGYNPEGNGRLFFPFVFAFIFDRMPNLPESTGAFEKLAFVKLKSINPEPTMSLWTDDGQKIDPDTETDAKTVSVGYHHFTLPDGTEGRVHQVYGQDGDNLIGDAVNVLCARHCKHRCGYTMDAVLEGFGQAVKNPGTPFGEAAETFRREFMPLVGRASAARKIAERAVKN